MYSTLGRPQPGGVRPEQQPTLGLENKRPRRWHGSPRDAGRRQPRALRSGRLRALELPNVRPLNARARIQHKQFNARPL